MKNYLKIVLTTIIIVLSISVNAQYNVDLSSAQKIGCNFISNNSTKSNPVLQLMHTEIGTDNTPNLYIFDIKDGGFVIISASKAVQPILAYSFDNNFGNEISNGADYFINNYNRTIDFVKENKINPDEDTNILWEELESNVIKNRTITVVDPLIQTKWDQGCYYNGYAPTDYYGPCGKALAGCVACAMSQVMKYWNYPEKGRGNHTYYHPDYGYLSADFGSTTYNWNEMPNEIWSDNDAIATLMYHCGVSVDMDFGPDASGAMSSKVETAMRIHFGYCSAEYIERSSCTEEEWIEMLKKELDESRPMYFSGNGEAGGHAIVCDGYDNNDYFHFNMGWSGYGNGFYSINDAGGFPNGQAVVLNIKPLPINSDENGIIYVSSDGDGDGSSWENATSQLHYAAALSTDNTTQIWVKGGTYYGNDNDDENAFYLYQNNRIYGGFSGNESADFDLSQRDFEANPSILDGQNSRRVLYQEDHFSSTKKSVWDGFTIQNGQSGAGGGAFLCSNSSFYNCKFINNNADGQGGTVYTVTPNDNSTNIFENCIFENNSASMGGAIFDMNGLHLLNSRFYSNTASTKGGAFYVFRNKQPIVVNCIFAKNNAVEGGGIYNRGTMIMSNCNIIGNNSENNSGGMFNKVKYSRFYNSVFWNNTNNGFPNQIEGETDLTNCAVEGGFEGVNIINLSSENSGSDSDSYPLFENPEINNYNISPTSALINKGVENNYMSETDISYGYRIGQGQVDIGAYEYQGGVEIDETANNNFVIYPNPMKDYINITGENELDINVYNALGQKIYSSKANGTAVINTEDWKTGIYIININGNIYKIIKKL